MKRAGESTDPTDVRGWVDVFGIRHLHRPMLGFALAGSTLGCTETAVFEHGTPLDEIARDGNFPQPARTRCGDLPPGLDPMPGLASAWAVIAAPGAIDPSGEDVPSGSTRIRLADHAVVNCTHQMFLQIEDVGPTGFCTTDDCSWGLEFTLPDATPFKDYELVDARRVEFGNTLADTVEPQGNGVDASVFLHRVTPDCIVGEVIGIEGDRESVPGEGGFVAEVCRSTCMPGLGDSC